MMLSITLPLPPSTNRLWRVFRGRIVKSPEYHDWIGVASRIIEGSDLSGQAIIGPYEAMIMLPLKGAGDADNRIKATVDLLVRLKLIGDDKHMMSVTAFRTEHVKSGLCRVSIFPHAPPATAPGGRRPKALSAGFSSLLSAESVEAAPS